MCNPCDICVYVLRVSTRDPFICVCVRYVYVCLYVIYSHLVVVSALYLCHFIHTINSVYVYVYKRIWGSPMRRPVNREAWHPAEYFGSFPTPSMRHAYSTTQFCQKISIVGSFLTNYCKHSVPVACIVSSIHTHTYLAYLNDT